ncbi:serine/threonine kinase 16 [Myxozyma melibiosi]|uniref:Serine/threonine kinase 16 n=1 Tax=Myxozyma melibiosi TaxID=54550 RepID=A0ABR1EZ35_9ASCO
MPFGILEDNHLDIVPGTANLNDQEDAATIYAHLPPSLLKHGKGRFSHVVLVPQPSDSPNDPLNWPQWKKECILLIVGFSAAVVGAYGPMLSPGFVVIAEDFGISVNSMSQTTSWLTLTIGLALVIINPLAKAYGKRPMYIFAITLMFTSCIWGGASTSFNSLLGSRIYAGFGMAPYEVLVQCTLNDMYFVHEKATRVAVWNLFLLCGISGGGLVAGYIIQNMHWKWTFWFCAIFFGVLMFFVFFFVPETTFIRPPLDIIPDQLNLEEKKEALQIEDTHATSDKEDAEFDAEREAVHPVHWGSDDPKKSFTASLAVYTGRYSAAPLWRIICRTLIVFFYPAVFWAFLVIGTTTTWIVVFSVVNASIFTAPPYNFSVSQTGLIGISPFVLVIIGELAAGPLNDYLCVYLAKKNKGIYESEFRLVLIIPVMILGACGFFGFGACVHYQTHWMGPVFTYGLANMSMAVASGCVFGYVMDSHPKLSEEAFVAINLRNVLTFGLTYFVNDWLEKDGALKVFCILGMLFVLSCLSTIPLWIFGKRARSFIARNKFLNDFMNDE